MGDSPKTKRTEAADAVAGLPDDPLTEILSRLPAKPLFRFKCVSKGWCDLIAGRLGRRKFPQTLEGFFYGGGGVNHGHFINLSGSSVPLVDASFSFLTKLPGIQNIVLLSAHNGLLLFGHFRNRHRYEYIVFNPATEQWVSVPSSGITPYPPVEGNYYPGTQAHNFLIFDPAVSSHFHLLQFCNLTWSETVQFVRVFSSETGVWRDIKEEGMQHEEVLYKLNWANVNGMFHIPVYKHYYQSQQNDIQIAVVDMQGKKSMAIHCPGMNEFAAPVFIGQSQGRPHCITGHKKQENHPVHITELSIWVLEDYDAAQCALEDNDAAQWVLKQSVSCLQLFGEISCGVDDLDVVAIHPDHNLVFFVHRYNWKLVSYDMDSEEVYDLCTLGRGGGLIIPYVPYFAEVPVLSCGASTDFQEGQRTIL